MSELERALRDLEIATAALAEIPAQDTDRAAELLAQRAKAITNLGGLLDWMLARPAEEREAILERLRRASAAGDEAGHRLEQDGRDALAQWLQWNHIHRSLGAEPSVRKVDYSG